MEKQKLPNAVAVLVLGIISIPACCFYGGGLIFSIIALVLAKKDRALYAANPEGYEGYSNLNTGRILAIIGLVLSILYILMMIAFVVMFGWAAMQDPVLMQERIRELSGQ